MHVDIDTVDGRRLGLERALRDAIRTGRLAPGAVLPSTRGLAGELGFARGTVTAAYEQLVAEGYLTARQGAATRVAEGRRQAVPQDARALPDPAPTRFDLSPGLPDGSAFPTGAWLRSTRRVLTGAPAGVHGPGEPQGRIELRTALAGYLGRTRGVVCTPDRIVITTGFHQSLALLAEVLGASGVRAVGMEDPGHNHYRDVVRRSGRAVVPLPVDGAGARFARLADPAIGAVVVTPAHQYPTGVPLDPRRRRELCRWAGRTGGLIVEDDYDGEFRYDRQPVGAMQGMAPEHVAYCGSVSKTLGQGVRLAWIVLPRHLVGAVVEAKHRADFATQTIGQLVLADLIERHDYDRHVRAARLSCRRRREFLIDRLAAAGPVRGRGTVQGVAAGLHALLTWPDDGPAERDVLAACAERGITMRGMGELWHSPVSGSGAGRRQGLLIGFAAPPAHAWSAAVDALVTALGVV
ncbi:PLP-dependent aminotransferase family protein [Streptomyces sp. SID3343]|uniref:MocR-like pyridoxine biosynthesis transcription factor PdxR n=1 Tax=Streptomyces sp. SID3343 TaxID=2690260 RepID=UPI001F26BF46|nr:PLP-dependent aminotransferase family protein [Streptomyces sp. SID3343]